MRNDGPVYAKPSAPSAKLEPIRTGDTAQAAADEKPDLGTFWGLLVLGLAYVHHSTTGYAAVSPDLLRALALRAGSDVDGCGCRFALPALLPLITPDLHLTDTQGSTLTAGYTVSRAVSEPILLFVQSS